METVHVKYVPNCTKFNLFKTLPGNRPVEVAHVNSIAASLELSKTFHGSLIVIKTKSLSKTNRFELYLGDGQHRLAACELLGVPYNYEVVSLVEDTMENIIRYVASINTSSKNWGLGTYLDAFASLGTTQYIKMQKIHIDHGFSVNDLIAIYNPSKADNVARFEFKTGKFEMCDEKDSDKLLNAIIRIKDVIPDRYNTRREIYPIFRQTTDYVAAARAIREAGTALLDHGSSFPKDGAELMHQIILNLVQSGVEFKEFGNIAKMPKKKKEMYTMMRNAVNKARRKLKSVA